MEILKYTKHSLEETHRTGIYYILNTLNGKFYIGSTSWIGNFPSRMGFRHRWGCHINDLKANRHESRHLQNAWNKYGEENFDFCIAEFVEPERCIEVEQMYLDLFPKGDREDVYNICFIAGSSLGCKRSEESRRKMSEAKKGTKASDETRLKMSESAKGIGAKEFYLVSPEGTEIKGKNIKEFATSLGINSANLHKVITGDICHYYGWTANLENHAKYKESYDLRGLGWDKDKKHFLVRYTQGKKQVKVSFKNFQDAYSFREILVSEGQTWQIKTQIIEEVKLILQEGLTNVRSTKISS